MSKTIQINPSLFNLGNNLSKTKKNREKKQKPLLTPFIKPNVLKNKLLQRIKQHKSKEISNSLDNETKNIDTINDISIYTNEFNDSIEYLKNLSASKKSEENQEKKTLKNRNLNVSVPHVELDLPDTLKEETIFSQMIIPNEPIISLNYTSSKDPPYGCLKNGSKPTYRSWNTSLKTREVDDPNLSIIVQQNNHNEESERAKRLKMLQEKIKIKQTEKITDNIVMTTNLIQINNKQEPISQSQSDLDLQSPLILHETDLSRQVDPVKEELIKKYKEEDELTSSMRVIKKTIRRKYTIGKSRIKNIVSILIKDRNTRKNILNAQRELRKKPINDIKVYLRDHALIKAGSNAPPNVIRKIYESAMLSGEITNNNKDILLHNFLKDKEE